MAGSVVSPVKKFLEAHAPDTSYRVEVVKAKADTHIVITQVATCLDKPNMDKKLPTEAEKIWKGVPLGITPPVAAAPTTIRETTARIVSINIEP